MKKVFFLILILLAIISYKIISMNLNEQKIIENTNNSSSEEAVMENMNIIEEKSSAKEVLMDGKWKLIWQDEFDSNKINKANWTALHRKDNYNNELQFYTQENAAVNNGALTLVGKKELKEGKNYTSGLIDTRGKFSFKYGRIDIKAKTPKGKGIFPAIWLLPDRSGKPYPEVDIMEMIGQEPFNIYGVVHYEESGKFTKNYNMAKIENYNEYHVYTLEWSESNLKWYVDNTLFHSSSIGVPQENMYILINLAIGGNWPGNPDIKTEFPSYFNIDYVRVYKEYTTN
jgi:beta-glucanase (GH16 family)